MDDKNYCYLCKKKLADDEGDEFSPFQLPELSDYPVMVCGACEVGKEHASNVEQTDLNHRAEESYQEWVASEFNE